MSRLHNKIISGCLTLLPTDHSSKKSHYSKITVKPGEVLNLLAVFEEQKFGVVGDDCKLNKMQKDSTRSGGREKKKGRYVQLMTENRKVCQGIAGAQCQMVKKLCLTKHLNIVS